MTLITLVWTGESRVNDAESLTHQITYYFPVAYMSTSLGKLGEILDHIKAVFPETGATLETLALPGILTSPLEGFSQEIIWYRFMCPEAECQKWITCNHTLIILMPKVPRLNSTTTSLLNTR
jgi:hypothetical protein